MSREKLRDEAFHAAVCWMESQIKYWDVTYVSHPDYMTQEEVDDVFWDVEEDLEMKLTSQEKDQALSEAYEYLDEVHGIEAAKAEESYWMDMADELCHGPYRNEYVIGYP